LAHVPATPVIVGSVIESATIVSSILEQDTVTVKLGSAEEERIAERISRLSYCKTPDKRWHSTASLEEVEAPLIWSDVTLLKSVSVVMEAKELLGVD